MMEPIQNMKDNPRRNMPNTPPKHIKEKLKEIKENRDKAIDEEQQQYEDATKIEDVYKQTVTVNGEKIPICNANAWNIINNYFDGIDNLDLSDEVDLGVVLYVLQHQKSTEIGDLTLEELHQKGREVLIEIPVTELPSKQESVIKMFQFIKKKLSMSLTKEIKESLHILNSLAEGSETSVSDLPKDSKNQ